MDELWPIQRGVAAALQDASLDSTAGRWIAGTSVRAAQGLAIYRANVAASMAKALGAAYPVICQVVGETYFEALCRAYHREHPSTGGDLYDYGAEFAAFLQDFEPAQKLPYLPDLARVEWAVHRAYGAADAEPWDLRSVEGVPPEHQDRIRFECTAGSALVASRFPVVRIWTLHQSEAPDDFNVDWRLAECAWVSRHGLRVEVSAVGVGAAAFLGALLAERTLGEATEAACVADPAFVLTELLSHLVSTQALSGFSVADLDPKTTKESIV